MQLLVNDFGGYSFIAQLSRALASRGSNVHHLYCDSLTTTPQGALYKQVMDSSCLSFAPIKLKSNLDKYSFFKRRRQEIEFGQLASQRVYSLRPHVVLSANTPLDAQRQIWKQCQRLNTPKVFWLQDIIGLAASKVLSKKLSIFGAAIGKYYIHLEQHLLRKSDAVIAISSEFLSYLEQARVPKSKTYIIENWAPTDEVHIQPKDNCWSRKRRLHEKIVLLYSGTLSLKHNPRLLLELAKAVANQNVAVVVRSQGAGADWLLENKAIEQVDNLILEPFGPYDELSPALAAADVLVAILENDASLYSVPSKVLTYLAAGRAILLAVPSGNLAAQAVLKSGAGVVVEPDNLGAFITAAKNLINNQAQRLVYAAAAAKYAQQKFNIESISEDFERVLNTVNRS